MAKNWMKILVAFAVVEFCTAALRKFWKINVEIIINLNLFSTTN